MTKPLSPTIQKILQEYQKVYRENHPNIDWSYSAPVSIPESNVMGFLADKLQELERETMHQTTENILEDISSYNVAFCNKCKSLFKAKHENCISHLKNTKGEE